MNTQFSFPQFFQHQQQHTSQDYYIPILQALLFILSIYLQKLCRNHLTLWGNQYKQLSRITFVSILTLILLVFNYKKICQPNNITFVECFYLEVDFKQCGQILVLNTVLFGYHIYSEYRRGYLRIPFREPSWVRSLIFAPLLEELLFRSVFYRSSRGSASFVYLALIFSLSHLHRPIRKHLKNKLTKPMSILVHLLITFIMALYCAYFLQYYNSVVPSMLLHSYCNYLGAPKVNQNRDFKRHLVCVVAFFLLIFIWL